jgi:hypothetical protein
MVLPEPDPATSFDYFSTQLGYRVTVLIHPPTEELLAGGLRFIDPNQAFPLMPYIEQSAAQHAENDPDKTKALINSALAWLREQKQSRDRQDMGMKVLNAAFHARIKAFTRWQRETLMPLVDKGEIGREIRDAVSTALANVDRIMCEEIAAKAGHTLHTSLTTPEGKFKTKQVRGRRVSVFKENLGRRKGTKNLKHKVTYRRIVKEIKRFKNNEYGHIPTRKQIAFKLGCDETTVKDCLLKEGEKRRFPDFARALLEEENYRGF